MSLHKMVNGERVECSPDEEAEILAEWAANDPAKQPAQVKAPSIESRLAALEAKLK